MPHEGRRSIGYRPFITCNDPRGVVESGTITRKKKMKKKNLNDNSWSNGHIKNNKRDLGKDLEESFISGSEEKRLKKTKSAMDDVRSHGLDSSEEPSTSSSQTNSVSLESFLSFNSSQKKDGKKSNLFARLMGRKVLNQQKPEFDPGKSSRKRTTFDQMIEALKFRGNMKSTVLNGVDSSPNSTQLDLSNSDNWLSIVLMKPSRFSCLNMEDPIIPKPRDEETRLHKMRVRTNPLAQPNEFGSFNEKELSDGAKVKASLTEKPRRVPKSGSSRGEKIMSSSLKQIWQKNDDDDDDDDEVYAKASSLVNGKQVYEDECEKEPPLILEDPNRLIEDPSHIEITDYVDDDQSSSNETPLSFSNWNNNNNKNKNTSSIYPNKEEEEEEEEEEDDEEEDEEEEDDDGCVSSRPSLVYICPRKASNGENKLKELLLSSPSFINNVQEYFNLQGNLDQDMNIEHNDQNARTLVDLANELVELHGYECSRARLPLPSTHKNSSHTCYTSLDQILDQVCEEIESFGCYVKDGHSTDNLLLLLKEDFKNTKMVARLWDVGWRNFGSGDEIEEITGGIDQIVLDELIQEIIVDLTL